MKERLREIAEGLPEEFDSEKALRIMSCLYDSAEGATLEDLFKTVNKPREILDSIDNLREYLDGLMRTKSVRIFSSERGKLYRLSIKMRRAMYA